MKPFLQCSWTFDTEAWAFSISTGNFHFVRASVPERLALPASNVAVGSVFNLDFPTLYVLYGNKELTLSAFSHKSAAKFCDDILKLLVGQRLFETFPKHSSVLERKDFP